MGFTLDDFFDDLKEEEKLRDFKETDQNPTENKPSDNTWKVDDVWTAHEDVWSV